MAKVSIPRADCVNDALTARDIAHQIRAIADTMSTSLEAGYSSNDSIAIEECTTILNNISALQGTVWGLRNKIERLPIDYPCHDAWLD